MDSMLPWFCTVIDHRQEQKSGTHGAAECVTDVLTMFWRVLWSITVQTHSNMEYCFYQENLLVLYNKEGNNGGDDVYMSVLW